MNKQGIPLNLQMFSEIAQPPVVGGEKITAGIEIPEGAIKEAMDAEAALSAQLLAGQPKDQLLQPDVTTQQPAAQIQQQVAAEAVFTQSQLDKIIQDRLKREREGQPSKEELKAFKEWQDSQKTQAQKDAEALIAAQGRANQAQAELDRYKQLESIRALNIDESFVGYVHYEAAQLASTSNSTFDEALSMFMKDKPNYVKQEKRQVVVATDAKNQEPAQPKMQFQFAGVRPRPGETQPY